MREKNQVTLGIAIAVLGGVLLLGSLLGVRLWRFIWPLALVGLGLYFVLRPRLVDEGSTVDLQVLGDIRRSGDWQVQDEEMWVIIGDTHLDFRGATIPEGETSIRVYGLVGSLEIKLPSDVALQLASFGVVTDAKVLGHKEESFFVPYRYVTSNYDSAERRLSVQTGHLVVDLDVEQE
jgi:lia operon protein LiaF